MELLLLSGAEEQRPLSAAGRPLQLVAAAGLRSAAAAGGLQEPVPVELAEDVAVELEQAVVAAEEEEALTGQKPVVVELAEKGTAAAGVMKQPLLAAAVSAVFWNNNRPLGN